MARPMHAPAIAPGDVGRHISKKRLSPPVKWSQGTIVIDIVEFSGVLISILTV
jgi:hypothetical protein